VDQKVLTRSIAILVLALAMVAAIARFGGGESESIAPDIRTKWRSDSLAAELERCRTLGLEAADDADCAAAWVENRERFFSTVGLPPKELSPKRQDRLLPEATAPSTVGEEAR